MKRYASVNFQLERLIFNPTQILFSNLFPPPTVFDPLQSFLFFSHQGATIFQHGSKQKSGIILVCQEKIRLYEYGMAEKAVNG